MHGMWNNQKYLKNAKTRHISKFPTKNNNFLQSKKILIVYLDTDSIMTVILALKTDLSINVLLLTHFRNKSMRSKRQQYSFENLMGKTVLSISSVRTTAHLYQATKSWGCSSG